MSRRRASIWLLPLMLYAAFVGWYTDFGGPLSDDEIAAYLDRFEALGFSEERRDRIRRFMESDTGRQFLMLNIVDYAENPADVPGAEPGASATPLMNRYMEHMYAELFSRACHPTVMGNAVHTALDLVGMEALDSADRWDMGALFRYRSRRTFLEIVTIPETLDRHEFKIAALDKTIAYPIETQLNLGDPLVLLGLILLSGAALTDLWSTRAKKV
ncbi:MAG: hypothetical protein JRG86_05795 [Deltaproteobacteria bacterium]|jgi:hypothetical protein|nr:hypothetical protein [Deltaproteobacteria bacterium]